MTPWKLPLVIAAIAVPIAAAFLLGGPGVGLAAGAVAAAALIVVAARQRPRTRIGATPGTSTRRRLLVVVSCPVEDARAVDEIAAEAAGGNGEADVMVLAPVRIGFLDRWASDLEEARSEAQRSLVITVASLARAGVEAEARVGDEDLVQAVEDATQSFTATEVILVLAEHDVVAAGAVAELEERLRARFRRLVVSDPPAR